jgi:hypothetical protein
MRSGEEVVDCVTWTPAPGDKTPDPFTGSKEKEFKHVAANGPKSSYAIVKNSEGEYKQANASVATYPNGRKICENYRGEKVGDGKPSTCKTISTKVRTSLKQLWKAKERAEGREKFRHIHGFSPPRG